MKLRFTIRDLFGLVLVAALAVGWWFDHRKLSNETLNTVGMWGPTAGK